MTLADKLAVRAPLGYGHGHWFMFNGEYIKARTGLIDFILERYARRFGKVSNELANELQDRLINKYFPDSWQTKKNLRTFRKCGFIYPSKDAYEADFLMREIEFIKKREEELFQEFLIKLNANYDAPDGEYCLSDKYKYDQCLICGVKKCNTVIYPKERSFFYKGKEQTYLSNGEKHVKTGIKYYNGWIRCNDKRCRAIAAFFKRGYGKKNYDAPLIKIILEITKHGGNNENFRRLEKHFIRHT